MKTEITIRLFAALLFIHVSSFLKAQVTPGSIIDETIPEELAEPAENCIKTIPVVIIKYFPTEDGINLDITKVSGYYTVDEETLTALGDRINKYNIAVKFSLEEGSKFRGYKNEDAVPYLGYKVLKSWVVYDQVPVSDTYQITTAGDDPVYQADYETIFEDFDLQHYIEEEGVKEVWIWYGQCAMPDWPSYDSDIHKPENYVEFVESNMSSPLTGDISNSYRFADDLPIYEKSYVAYCYNIKRSQAEAVHDHGHQLEAMYNYIAKKQDGDNSLFINDFCGYVEDSETSPIGRAGDCHHPPNTDEDYDYENTTLVQSDIEDWIPEGGTTKAVNCNTWGDIDYDWPDGDLVQKTESQWYIYWMQSMPGYQNQIPYGDTEMENWWQFTADWDSCIANDVGLYNYKYTYDFDYSQIEDVEGNVYKTIRIGNQDWMAENLKTTTYIDGSSISYTADSEEWKLAQEGLYTYYNLDESNIEEYGLLYNWYSVETDKLCPSGWHVPLMEDWDELVEYLGGEDFAGGKLKTTGFTYWESPNECAVNSTGFSALPGGYCNENMYFLSMGGDADWWTRTEEDNETAYRKGAHACCCEVTTVQNTKSHGFSIRCVKNETSDPVITMVSQNEMNSDISLSLSTTEEKIPIWVDFGDDIQHFYYLSNDDTTLVDGSLGLSGQISVYTDTTNIAFINCSGNGITSLDLKADLDFEALNCSGNSLTFLDISNNDALSSLDCSNNQLEELILNENSKFEKLYCQSNNLTELSISENQISDAFYLNDNYFTFATLPLFVENHYAPQKVVEILREVSVGEGVDLSDQNVVEESYSSYNWYKKSDVALEEGVDYEMTDGVTYFKKTQEDSVYCKITNDYFPEFTGENVLFTSYISVLTPTSVNEIEEVYTRIWTNDNIVLIHTDLPYAKVFIHDLTGRLLKETEISAGTNSIPLQGNGLYLVTVKDPDGINCHEKVLLE